MKLSKKLIITALTLAATSLVVACGGAENNNPQETPEIPAEITDFRIPVVSKSMFIDETFDIKAEALPHSWMDRGVTYKSLDPSIASVDDKGIVTANAKGYTKILVSNKDGSVTKTVDISVFRPATSSGPIATAVSEVEAAQTKVDVNNLGIVSCYENWDTTVVRNGKLKSASYANQYFIYSTKDAYFYLKATEYDVLAPEGSKELVNYGYLFYVTEQYNLRVFRFRGDSGNYLDVSCSSSYDEGKSRLDVLYLTLDNFFTSGHELMTSNLEYFLSSSLLSVATSSNQAGTNGEAKLCFDYAERSVRPDVADYDDEQYRDIPVNTEYNFSIQLRTSWDGAFCKDRKAIQQFEYKINDDEYVRTDNIDYKFVPTGTELIIPDVTKYTRVDTLFDL